MPKRWGFEGRNKIWERETKTGRCWVQEENTDMSWTREWPTRFNMELLNNIVLKPLMNLSREFRGWRFTVYLTFESPKSRLFEIKHGWSRGTWRSRHVHVLSACVTGEARLLPSPQWKSALSERPSRLVPIGLWLLLNNINQWLTAWDSGVCSGARVQNWQNKGDTSSFWNLSFSDRVPCAIKVWLWYEHSSWSVVC